MSAEHSGTRRRSRRKKRALGWIVALVLLVAAGVGAKFSYHWLKAKRAEQFDAQAEEFVRESKWNEAAQKYRAALQLDPLGYRGLHGAAALASQLARPEAGDLW